MAYILCTLKDMKLSAILEGSVRQYDDLPVELVVQGDIGVAGDWELLVAHGNLLNIVRLSRSDDELIANTSSILAMAGMLQLQLRKRTDDSLQHTSIASVCIPHSLSGCTAWPTIPAEFTQLEVRMLDINNHPPVPGPNGYWMVWNPDTQAYEQSPMA